jgi:hypothetical protein
MTHATATNILADFVDKHGGGLRVFANQMGSAQQTKILRDRRARNRKRLGDLAGGLAASPEQIKNGA